MAGSKKGDINKGRFSKTNQPMNDESVAAKNAASRIMSEVLIEQKTKPSPKSRKIKEEVLTYIGDSILKEDKKGNSFIKDFIDKSLEIAKKDPKSPQAGKFLNILFREDLLEQLTDLYSKKEDQDRDFNIYRIRQTLYDKQQEVYDNEIDKRILIINSRRSGKTELLGRIAAKELLNPNGHVVYINRSSAAAKRQIRDPLEKALAKTNLRLIKGSIDAQELHFDNGSQMLVIGNNNSADIHKLRGERISCCILDECGHQRNMREIIREVIRPAMMDYGDDSQLIMVGTPPRNPHTYIEEIYNGAPDNGWKLYHWTFQDNPFVKNRENVISEVCKENGVTEDSAFIQREYFGKMGVYDTDAMVFRGYKTTDILPNKTWSHAYVGVDWGYEDRAAVVACLADITLKKMYIVRTWTQSHIGTTETCKVVADMVEWLKENFHIAKDPWIIVDNNDKQGAADLCTIYKLKNVYCAYKYDLEHSIEELTGWLRVGDILTLKKDNDGLIEDFENTLWTRDEETDAIRHVIDDDIWHPNAAHALRYVSRVFAWDILGKQAKTLHNMVENTEPTKYEWRK